MTISDLDAVKMMRAAKRLRARPTIVVIIEDRDQADAANSRQARARRAPNAPRASMPSSPIK
jgi:hypothetical protein